MSDILKTEIKRKLLNSETDLLRVQKLLKDSESSLIAAKINIRGYSRDLRELTDKYDGLNRKFSDLTQDYAHELAVKSGLMSEIKDLRGAIDILTVRKAAKEVWEKFVYFCGWGAIIGSVILVAKWCAL